MTSEQVTADLADALTAISRAREIALTAAARPGDPQRAFEIATVLAPAFREASDEIAACRAIAAGQIREQESLSLAGLAERLGVSRARAMQLSQLADRRKDQARD